jgi:hypothetical protein
MGPRLRKMKPVVQLEIAEVSKSSAYQPGNSAIALSLSRPFLCLRVSERLLNPFYQITN